jgi:uncharacterized protein
MSTFFEYRCGECVYLKSLDTNSVVAIDSLNYEKSTFAEVVEKVNEKVEFVRNFDTTQDNELSLVILTTMECNFSCSYCFENGHRGNINILISNVKLLASWIRNTIKGNSVKTVDITFTGGEPLLNFNVIAELVELLSELDIEITYGLITNGYFLNHDILQFLDDHRFMVQLSFDEDSVMHNQLRRYKNSGTFNIILNKIVDIVNNYPRIKCNVRVNIVDAAPKHIEDLINEMKDRISDSESLFLYADFLDVLKPSSLIIDKSQKWKLMTSFLWMASNAGFKIVESITSGANCMAKSKLAYTVGCDGNIYKCYSLVGVDEFIVGNISTSICGGNTNDEICTKDCIYKDMCNGGCYYKGLLDNGKFGKFCEYDYIDKVNKFLFLNEVLDDTYGEIVDKISKVEVITI